jgi:hypothetical protein
MELYTWFVCKYLSGHEVSMVFLRHNSRCRSCVSILITFYERDQMKVPVVLIETLVY